MRENKKLFQCWIDKKHYDELRKEAQKLHLSTSSYGRIKLIK